MAYVSSITISNGLVKGLSLSAISTADVTGALGYTPLSGNQLVTLSGDATGSGTTAITVTLATSGVSAGSYGDAATAVTITVDAKGRITAVSQASISIDVGTQTTGTLAVSRGGTGQVTLAAHAVLLGAGASALATAAAGTAGRILVDQGALADPVFAAVSGDATLASTGALALAAVGADGNFGDGTHWATVTVDAKGRVTGASQQQVFWTGTCEGRLTLTSGTPVTTADVTGATTIYWTPYKGNRVALWNGSSWIMRTFTETSLALGTLTSGIPHDVFAFDNSGTLNLEKLAWTSDTARATAVTLQDGVACKSGDKTRRYLGSFRTTSTTATEDSAANRYVFNAYHQVPKTLLSTDATNRTTSSTTYIQIGSVQVSYLSGLGESFLLLHLVTACADAGGIPIVAVGSATNTVATGCCLLATASSATVPLTAVLAEHPAAGAYTRYGIVKSSGGTAQINSNVAGGTDPCTSLSGTILC